MYLFAGPRRQGDIDSLAKKYNAEVHAFDIERSKQHDLMDDTTFSLIVKQIREGMYDAGFASPPCASFSPVRGKETGSGGPRPLRGATVPEIYGYAYLSQGEQEQVRELAPYAL